GAHPLQRHPLSPGNTRCTPAILGGAMYTRLLPLLTHSEDTTSTRPHTPSRGAGRSQHRAIRRASNLDSRRVRPYERKGHHRLALLSNGGTRREQQRFLQERGHHILSAVHQVNAHVDPLAGRTVG